MSCLELRLFDLCNLKLLQLTLLRFEKEGHIRARLEEARDNKITIFQLFK
jgi:hypothetical protein